MTLLMIVIFLVMTTTMIHADPFKELMLSCKAVVYMIVYINGLKCTIFPIFYLCHTVELSYYDSNSIANR
jgi:hypothetical protein